MKKILIVIVMFVFAGFFFACKKDKTATLNVHMTDAPGDFDAVFLDVQAIELNTTAKGDENWLQLDVVTTVFNLLDFTNGLDTLLGTTEIEAGRISQIRLILGDKCSVVKDGEEYTLDVPSGEISGLKLNVQYDFEEGITYHLWIDFDASRSIVKNAYGYSLKPVIRVFTEALSGAITGVVEPEKLNPFLYAIINSDTLGTIADSTGHFLIKGAKEGTYKMVINGGDNYLSKEIENVEVVNGEVKDLGTIVLDVITK